MWKPFEPEVFTQLVGHGRSAPQPVALSRRDERQRRRPDAQDKDKERDDHHESHWRGLLRRKCSRSPNRASR